MQHFRVQWDFLADSELQSHCATCTDPFCGCREALLRRRPQTQVICDYDITVDDVVVTSVAYNPIPTRTVVALGTVTGVLALYDTDRISTAGLGCPRIAYTELPADGTQVTREITCMSWSSNGCLLAVAAGRTLYTYTYDPSSCALAPRARLTFDSPLVAARAALAGAQVLVAESAGSVHVIDTRTDDRHPVLTHAHAEVPRRPLKDISQVRSWTSRAATATISDAVWLTSDVFATCGSDCTVRLWSLPRLRGARAVPPRGVRIANVPEWTSYRLTHARLSSCIACFDAPTLQKTTTPGEPGAHNGVVSIKQPYAHLAYSPCTGLIAATNLAGVVQLLPAGPFLAYHDLAARQSTTLATTVHTFHNADVTPKSQIAFTCDGRHLVYGSRDPHVSFLAVPAAVPAAAAVLVDDLGLGRPRAGNGWPKRVEQSTFMPHHGFSDSGLLSLPSLTLPCGVVVTGVATHPSDPAQWAAIAGTFAVVLRVLEPPAHAAAAADAAGADHGVGVGGGGGRSEEDTRTYVTGPGTATQTENQHPGMVFNYAARTQEESTRSFTDMFVGRGQALAGTQRADPFTESQMPPPFLDSQMPILQDLDDFTLTQRTQRLSQRDWHVDYVLPSVHELPPLPDIF